MNNELTYIRVLLSGLNGKQCSVVQLLALNVSW